eukprot:1188844-Prorocentrum_minimum.AAC.2
MVLSRPELLAVDLARLFKVHTTLGQLLPDLSVYELVSHHDPRCRVLGKVGRNEYVKGTFRFSDKPPPSSPKAPRFDPKFPPFVPELVLLAPNPQIQKKPELVTREDGMDRAHGAVRALKAKNLDPSRAVMTNPLLLLASEENVGNLAMLLQGGIY